MEINIISKQSNMKRGSFCDIVNVNKESKGEITLPCRTPQDILLYEDLNAPILVHCNLLCRKFESSL